MSSILSKAHASTAGNFRERFERLRRERRSVLCVGLDPDANRIPAGYASADAPSESLEDPDRIYSFLSDVIRATAQHAVAFKPNLAFFECLGPAGMQLFERVLKTIRDTDPEVLILADAKRGDIGNTAERYARSFFEYYGCDAITLSPYMGLDTLEPFLRDPARAAIALCHTSNPGAPEFQNVGEPPVHLRVAAAAQRLGAAHGNVWLVVGATRDASSIAAIRAAAPDVGFLIPGVGAQGGDLHAALAAAGPNVMINATRSIIYAADHRDQLAAAALAEVERMLSGMREAIDFRNL